MHCDDVEDRLFEYVETNTGARDVARLVDDLNTTALSDDPTDPIGMLVGSDALANRSERTNRTLNADMRRDIEAHLRACEVCDGKRQDIELFSNAATRWQDEPAPQLTELLASALPPRNDVGHAHLAFKAPAPGFDDSDETADASRTGLADEHDQDERHSVHGPLGATRSDHAKGAPESPRSTGPTEDSETPGAAVVPLSTARTDLAPSGRGTIDAQTSPSIGRRPGWAMTWLPVAASVLAAVLVMFEVRVNVSQDAVQIAFGSSAADVQIGTSESGLSNQQLENQFADFRMEQQAVLARSLQSIRDEQAQRQAALAQALVTASRDQRREELRALTAVLSQQMDEQVQETNDNLRYVMDHQAQDRQRLRELSNAVHTVSAQGR